MTNLTTGLWKFHESVPLEVLQEVAEEWAKDERYKYLYIRWASKDQRAIGFTYEKEDGAKGTHEKFFEEITDKLKKKFGNSLVGWDVSSTTYTIKGF
ncbi:hypothetical protein A2886_03360 [candidate division WWE3 bacterium RIFCSPHIGHO2_01_FULL_42_13]|uniref:ABM domain-containing protein n=1 Tax=candidate division WWE3 bacterium RIFCSPHIGHO2_01_FULL_42_13 TaxID=1802617 RepID=A0A1F4UR49_UNCKA|nr:MAG: hypothetical protein A2886_03360 [candidate division WWE3 bacterium RIFCSPHIGHO2_01_FULL_42_13]